MTDSITIKLKPYLQEFIIGYLNEDCIKASNRNFIGRLLNIFIEDSPKDYKPQLSKNKEFINVELKWFQSIDLRGNLYISNYNQKCFESILEDFFKQLFYQYMDDKIRYSDTTDERGKFKKCMLDFCDFYHIGYNHINYETLKKSYYRYRIKNGGTNIKKHQKKSVKLSLSCPLIFLL